ncbi:MAG: methyltransferase domain-containing protein [Leptospiraceae bacterium]|nr:methyltransferase domain-containing protein [Leptospiraceae bacterium]MDW7976498.1 methyltransferase domain-containing protein [Leptospiraceae bacterium]
MKKKDVGNGIYLDGKWSFSHTSVVENFDVHIRKSIPLYEEGHQIILDVLKFYLKPSQKYMILDLGCSSGILLEKISQEFKHHSLYLVGVDKEEKMIQQAKKRNYSKDHQIEWVCSDMVDYNFPKHHIGIAYYVFQFLPKEKRVEVLAKIYHSLKKKGLLFFFEKTHHRNPILNKIHSHILFEYKRRQGYSQEEILNKEKSLKGVLLPNTLEENFGLIQKAGFETFTSIFQYGSFVGWLLIK